MAALTYQSVNQPSRRQVVTRSTADTIGSADVAIIIDNTLDKQDVREALNGALRAVNRDFGNVTAPANIPTSGSTEE